MVNSFEKFIRDCSVYLENNQFCHKHHIEHSGKNIYIIDFYCAIGEFDKAKEVVLSTVKKIVKDGNAWVFYPGRLNHNNHANNIIDCGAIVDCISVFLKKHADIFSNQELHLVNDVIKKVVETYLIKAVVEKPITNQRLWGLTGLASYYSYSQRDDLIPIIKRSIDISLSEMTSDGFFIYHPHTLENNVFTGYSGLTTYYQSRCTAFIYYAIEKCNLELGDYEDRLEKSVTALISMYTKSGYKDLLLECKKWYWLSDYEVASASFDLYALSRSKNSVAEDLINNILFVFKKHIINGKVESCLKKNANFQCNVFWTSHSAWIIRSEISELWSKSKALLDFNVDITLDEVINLSNHNNQIIINRFWQKHNFTAGLVGNGLVTSKKFFIFKLLLPDRNMFLSIKETLNHIKVALRGYYFYEAIYRFILMLREVFISFLPIYYIKYGKIVSVANENDNLVFSVLPATKFGDILDKETKVYINKSNYKINKIF